MIRTNLSTRPFYNERAVHVVIAVAAVLVLALTVLNIVRIVTLSRHNTELAAQIEREQVEAQRLTREAETIRRGIDKDELQVIVNAAYEANALIDQRTFSWTEFFNRIEATLPPDVMLVSIRPSVVDNVTHVQLTVLGRRAEDIDEFMEQLEGTGAFEEVVPASQDRTEEGLYRVLIQSIYTREGEGAPAGPAAAAPASAPTGSAPAGVRQ